MSTSHNQNASRALRAVCGVVAALVIAFCGWSAFQYANGNDPLAFLGGGALQTVAEDDAAESSSSLKTVSNTVTVSDVTARIAKLSYGGADVSLASDDVRVVLSDGGIWVENASQEEAGDAVSNTAFRAAALAKWAVKRNVGLKRVVWITEDTAGAVRIVVSYSVDRASKNETATDILGGCTGYRISGDTYAALGDNPGFPQKRGTAPELPDGAEITVIEDATEAGESLGDSDRTYTVLTEGGTSADASAESGSSDSDSSTSSSDANADSGSTSAGQATSNDSSSITVSITVDGSAAGAGSSSATLSLTKGATVYDALSASGVGFNAGSSQYGTYVSAIGGLAEKEYGSKSGWMYSVDGVTPMTACSNYTLSDGDSVVWYYVTGD